MVRVSASGAIVGFVNPAGLNARVVPIPLRVREPVRTEALHVGGRLRVEEGLDEQTADAAGTGDTVGIATAGHDKTFYLAAFADDEAAIRSEGRPTFADEVLLSACGLGQHARETRLKTVQDRQIGNDLGRRAFQWIRAWICV